jgi:hypothetical protein
MAPELCLEGTVVKTTEKFSDRKIWQIGRSAIILPVTESSDRYFAPLLTTDWAWYSTNLWGLIRMQMLCSVLWLQFCVFSSSETMHQAEVVQAIKDKDFRRFSVACVQLENVDFVAGTSFENDFFKGEYGSGGSFDQESWTPLMVLCAGARICEKDELCREHMVSLLLGCGADPNYSDSAGQYCLGQSILLHRPIVARMLLRAGARPRQSGIQIDHTIMLAVQCQPDLVPDLAKHGARVNAMQDNMNYGDRAMCVGAYDGLRALTRAGFDLSRLDASDGTGFASTVRTPKDPAKVSEWRRTVRWIRKRLSKDGESAKGTRSSSQDCLVDPSM